MSTTSVAHYCPPFSHRVLGSFLLALSIASTTSSSRQQLSHTSSHYSSRLVSYTEITIACVLHALILDDECSSVLPSFQAHFCSQLYPSPPHQAGASLAISQSSLNYPFSPLMKRTHRVYRLYPLPFLARVLAD